MKRIVWLGDKDFRIEEVSGFEDTVLGSREVLLRVKAVGICRTDIHIMDGRFSQVVPPIILGHEIAGIIERVGPIVARVRPGTRVTCDSVVGCGQCEFCRRGSRQFCQNGYELGFSRDQGGCQELLIIPDENVHPVGGCVSMEEAAILDMEVYAALKKSGVRTTDRVLIIGPGPSGLIAVQVARVFGAAKVLVSGETDERLEVGRQLGADRTINIRKEDLAEVVQEETEGLGVDLVMDCAGTEESFEQALEAVCPGGRLVLYGVYPDPLAQAHVVKIVLKDLTVYGSLSDRKDWDEVITLVEHGKLKLKRLITHKFPLLEAPAAYEQVRNQRDGLVKAVLQA
jgi:2-desacetyl-2-hydroxyethyl bacteriochlorophyllide A dehydrogenase